MNLTSNRRPLVLDRSFTRIFAAALACVSAHAATITWDITPGTVGAGDSAITGGSGTWDLANGNWTADAGVNNVAWTNGDSAIFGGAGGTVTLGAAISVDDVTFSTAGYSIAGGTLMLAGTPAITTTADASISSALAGTDGFTKLGAGQLTLSGANAFTGLTIVDNGTLVLGNTSGVSINGNVQMGSGVAGNQPNLRMAANGQFGAGVVMDFVNPFGSFPRFDLQGTTQTLAGINNATGAGVIQNEKLGGGGTAAAGTLTLNGSGTYAFNGFLRDEDDGGHVFKVNVVKGGTGTQTLSGGNITYQGTTTVNGGTLESLNNTAFASAVTVNSGGTFRISNSTASAAYSPLGGTAPIVVNAGGVLELNNATTGYGNRKTLGASVSGGGTLNIVGTGYLALPSVNNITLSGQINVISGGLGNDSGNAANAFGANTASLDISSGAYFDLRGGASQVNALSGGGMFINSWSAVTATVGVANGSGTFTGTMKDGGNVETGTGGGGGSVLSLTKVGTGTQTLGATNAGGSGITYTGTTTVSGGTLALVDARLVGGAKDVASGATLEINSTIPFSLKWNNSGTISGAGVINKTGSGVFGTTGAVNFSGTINILDGRLHNDNVSGNWAGSTADVNVSAGAVLDLRANDIFVDELNGLGEVWNSHPAGGGDTLFVGVANGSSSYGGAILGNASQSFDNPNGAVLSLAKQGTGTFTITGTGNIYSGPTTVNNGTLRIAGGNDRLPTATNLVVNGGTFDLNGLDQTVAQLNGTGGSVSGGGLLTVNGSVFSSYAGNITGATALTKAGNGTLALSGANTSTGATLVSSGTLRLTDVTTFTSSLTVAAGAFLEENRTAGSGSFTVPVSGAGSYVKQGAGETIVTSPIALPHTVVRGGTLTAGANNVFTAATNLSQGGPTGSQTFKLNGTSQTVGALGSQYDFGNRIVGGNATPGSLTVDIGAGQQTFYGGKIGDVGADENNLGITKIGSGTLVLSGTASYTGGTIISGGTLQLGASTTMPVNLATIGIWLDGADPAATGSAPADGAAISVWKNKGALGATGDFGAVAGQEPSYSAAGFSGNPAVRFVADAVAGFGNQTNFDRLTNTINLANGPSTILVAGRYASANADERKRLVSGLGNNYLLGWWNNGENAAYYQNGFAPGISAATTSAHVYTSIMRGDGIGETYANALGKIGVLGNAVGPNGLALGGGNTTNVQEYSTGDIGEVIIAPGTLNDGDRGAIEAYLVRKWTGFIPANPLPTSGTLSLSASGTTLNVNGVTQTVGSVSGVAGTSILLGGGSLAVGNDSGNAQFDGVISGTGSLFKNGTGTWTLSGANTYSAITSVRDGTLALSGGADRLPTSTSVELGTSTTSGTLKLGGNHQTIAGLSSPTSPAGAGSRVINDSTVAATLTVNLASGISNYTGKLGGSTADENNLGFIKQGAGTLVLGQSSTYTGATTISGGTVQLGGARALPTSAAIWLDATDGGTINTSGGGVTSVVNKGTLGVSGDFTAPVGNEPTLAFEATMGGNQVIRFDALTAPGPDQLNNGLNFANDVTVAYIGRLAGTANQRLLSAGGNNWLLGTWMGSADSAYFDAGFLHNSGVADTAPRFHVGTIAANGAAAYYSNGTLLGTGGGVGPNSLRLGGGFLNSGTELSSGDIGELFVFNGVLTDTHRKSLDSYIARKWYGLGTTNVLPATTAVALSGGAILDVNGTDQTVASLVGAAGTSVINTGILTVGDATSTTFAGVISGNGTFTKAGAGKLTLSGTNTPTGNTYVQGGTLEITGSLSGSILEVQTGGTLGGNGSIGADVYVLAGGKLAPGTSPGTLTITGTTLDFSDAVFAANSQSLVFELGTTSGRVNLTTGSFGIGSGVLDFDDFAFTAGSGFGPGTYTLFDSSVDVFGTLGTSLSGTIDGYAATLALGDTDNDIVLNVVPEPGSAVLLLGGLAMLASRRKRPQAPIC